MGHISHSKHNRHSVLFAPHSEVAPLSVDREGGRLCSSRFYAISIAHHFFPLVIPSSRSCLAHVSTGFVAPDAFTLVFSCHPCHKPPFSSCSSQGPERDSKLPCIAGQRRKPGAWGLGSHMSAPSLSCTSSEEDLTLTPFRRSKTP